jgi:hypothetical protein
MDGHTLMSMQQGFRHVAIGGASFTGSTALGILLGSLDGAANIGESHWLVDGVPRIGNGSSVMLDFAVDPPPRGYFAGFCRVCGRDCPALNPEFRVGLAADPTGWYRRIAQQLQADILVSSDKAANSYRRLAPDLDFDLIVLYRNPADYIRSTKRKTLFNLTNALKKWVNTYQVIDQLQPHGKRIFLNWDSFAARPVEHFEHLLEILELPGTSAIFNRLRLGHFIGGSRVREVMRTKRFSPQPSAAPLLADEEVAAVQADKSSESLFQRLEDGYRGDFRNLFFRAAPFTRAREQFL